MSLPLIYVNGHFVPGPLEITVADAGFVYGATVTDLVRTFGRKLYRLDDHLARFRESCRLCRVPLPLSVQDLRSAAEKLVASNFETDLIGGQSAERALVVLATPGLLLHYAGGNTEMLSPAFAAAMTESRYPLYLMHTFPLLFSRYRKLFTDGAVLVVPPTRALPAECVDPRAKMRSRMHWWIAEQQAREVDPDASALLLDATGHVTETASANIAIVKIGTVLTPPRDRVLNGISLQVVEELCSELGIPFAESPLTLADCQSADEAMLTCTSYCIAGVRRINDLELPWPGPIWRRLLAAWSERVGVDIEGQILQSEK
jgi:branched-subunit amino acid aminotransferase/4-amino-4-deoxychorismate lyase